MTSTDPTPSNTATTQWVYRARYLLSALLLALAIGLIGLVGYLVYRGREAVVNWPLFYWAVLVGFYSLAAGLTILQPVRPGSTEPEAEDNAAFTFLTWALPTAVTSILLSIFFAFTPEYRAILSGGFRKWAETPWPVVWTLLPLVVGVVLIGLLPFLVRTPRGTALDWLARQRVEVSLTLLGLALMSALVLVVGLSLERWSFIGRPLFYWAGLVSITSLITGLVVLIGEMPVHNDERERIRLVLLTFGGIVGLATAGLGLVLPFTNEYQPIFGGGLKEWRDSPWALINTATAFLLGLVLLFASLNLARGAERSSGLMRRLLYGYNVILSSVLLLLILVLVNVLSYARLAPFNILGRTFDWTSSNLYTIDTSTRNFLSKLDKPVKIFVLEANEIASRELENLLETCKTYTSNLNWESLNRERNLPAMRDLHKKYNIPEPRGLLLVYGTGKDEVTDFIKISDIFRGDRGGAEEAAVRFNFTGEDALMKSLTYLAEGKAKPVIHALQGHGELDPSSREANEPNVGLGAIAEFLKERNYEIKGLRFSPGEKPAVPDDVKILLIARPTQQIPPPELDAIRAFVKGADGKKKGKLIVLADVVPDGAKFMKTGLETLLADFNVKLGEERILCLRGPAPQLPDLLATGPVEEVSLGGEFISRRQSRHPISQAFLSNNNLYPFLFLDTRSVEAAPAGKENAPAPYRVEPFLYAPLTNLLWTETNLSKPAEELAAHFRKVPEDFTKVMRADSIPVAVAVWESKGGAANPRNPQAGPVEEPRLIVFGDATWASNYGAEKLKAAPHKGLFLSSINWLRERPDLGEVTIKGPPRKEYLLNVKPEDVLRLLLLPGGLVLLGIVVLGLGVWVVRRR